VNMLRNLGKLSRYSRGYTLCPGSATIPQQFAFLSRTAVRVGGNDGVGAVPLNYRLRGNDEKRIQQGIDPNKKPAEAGFFLTGARAHGLGYFTRP
jgi:hypothetical protein